MLDLILAIAHHLAVFTYVAMFAAEFALLRPGPALDPAYDGDCPLAQGGRG